MFNFIKPSSLSVYTLFFFLTGPEAGFVFCCFGGAAFGFLEIRLLLLEPMAFDLLEVGLFDLALAPFGTFLMCAMIYVIVGFW